MPLAKVLHHEMASYGDTYDTGCARNRLRFCERWEEFLSKATYTAESTPVQGESSNYKKGDIIKTTDNTTKTFGFKRAKRK